MKILMLGPRRPELVLYLESFNDDVMSVEDKITVGDPRLEKADYLISYGYRYILKQDVLKLFPQKAINLHISLLPWNRGADPNLWSFLENTPKGVTIHLLEDGIDTGDILAQRTVEMNSVDTLRSSYERLSKSIEELFRVSWPQIRQGEIVPRIQLDGGSFHRLTDKTPYEHLLICGWDTPVSLLVGKANQNI